jgi:DNA-binding GntR family transcriptional regulator
MVSRDELVDSLRKRIRSGDLRPGDQLPFTAELMAEYGVSRSTVYEAIRDLTKEGLIRGRQGVARYVASPESEETSQEFVVNETPSPEDTAG